MLETLRSFFRSRKFILLMTAILVQLAPRLGWNVTPDDLELMNNVCMLIGLLIGAIALEDLGSKLSGAGTARTSTQTQIGNTTVATTAIAAGPNAPAPAAPPPPSVAEQTAAVDSVPEKR